MISSAFKGAYQNQVAQQNQGINTISSGVKDAATAIIGAMGFAGALGSGTLASAAKFGLANKIGGVGGALMVATMDEKSQTQDNALVSASDEQLGQAFDSVAKDAKTSLEFESLDTVWNTIQKQRQKAREEKIMKDIESRLKEEDDK